MMTSTPWRTPRRLAAGALGLQLLLAAANLGAANAGKVDQLFAPWNRADSPGAAIVVVQDGAVVYLHGYGCANLEHHVPITPQTLFDLASVAKQFTGLSVAMLVQQGKLSLDDEIHKHLPDLPDFGKPITLNNLLHHSSGLRDWPETLALSDVDLEGPITLDTILEMVRRQRESDFPPGDEEQYSNTGYNLLAAAVAKVSGQSFRAWTDRNLFQPLEMKHTFVCDNPAEVIPNRADSYAPDGRNRFHQVVSQLAAQGSSSLFTSAEDMGRWLLNFETARVGGKAALALMQQPGKLNHSETRDYGFGLVLGTYHGMTDLSHGGSWAGYRSQMIWVPDKHFGAAILANTSDMDTWDLTLKLTDLYLGISPAPAEPTKAGSHAPVKADPAAWDPFLGTYRLGPGCAADHHPRRRSPGGPGNSRQVPDDTAVRHQFLRASLRTARGLCPSKLRCRHQPALPRHQRPETDPARTYARPPCGLRRRLLERRATRYHSPRTARRPPGRMPALRPMDSPVAHRCRPL